MSIKKLDDLEVYTLSFKFAMGIFNMTMAFPKDEKYSLTDQIRRSSRSISSNIAEGWGKRIYPQNFKKYLVDALGSLEETKNWLVFSKECGYITDIEYQEKFKFSEEIGAKLWKLHQSWK